MKSGKSVKIRDLVILSVLACSCSGKPVKETTPEPLAATGVEDDQRQPAEAAKPRTMFNGELSTVVETLRDPEERKQAMVFAYRYQNMVRNNLHDTGVDPGDPAECPKVMAKPHRTADGRCYFYGQKVFADEPNVGANGQRLGRNSRPPEQSRVFEAAKNLLDPNPRLVSKELLERKNGKTIEVPTLNLLAAAWLQMENHDWFSHGKNVRPEQGEATVKKYGPAYQRYFDSIKIPAVPGDTLFPNGMEIPRTRPDLTSTARKGYPLTYRNVVTHWWDASQIYGSDARAIQKIRTNPETGQIYPGGLIAVDEKNRRLYYENGVPITGFHDNWWVGLELLHSLFALEHNSVARMLKEKHPALSDDEIFEKSRLVVSALIAKIHTLEWTPALLDSRVGQIGMYTNWHGMKRLKTPQGREFANLLSRSMSHFVNGLTGPGGLNLYKVPFTLTEEFVAVYRMHPLLPDFIRHRSPENPASAAKIPMQDTTFGKAETLVGGDERASRDLLYSFLTDHPGALTVNNFPKFLQPIEVQRNTEGVAKITLDMGTLDILRDRERLVPRYNEFRRQLGLKDIKTWADLTPDKEVQAKLQKVYGNDVEKLDLLVGSLAESDRPEGFAFGVTPFSIFQIMASRRLMADPFFTEYFTPEHYTAEGLEWVDKTTIRDVISRHYPELKGKLANVINGFHPWNK